MQIATARLARGRARPARAAGIVAERRLLDRAAPEAGRAAPSVDAARERIRAMPQKPLR